VPRRLADMGFRVGRQAAMIPTFISILKSDVRAAISGGEVMELGHLLLPNVVPCSVA
jgi:hypothetical protein